MKPPPARKVPNPYADREIVKRLARLAIYGEYARAFRNATGLPFTLHSLPGNPLPGRPAALPCVVGAEAKTSCETCCSFPLRKGFPAGVQSRQCLAGLIETSLPVRGGGRVIGFLLTGQVFLQKPSRVGFDRMANTSTQWGASPDLTKIEKAYFKVPVIPLGKYESLIDMLAIFARHLESYANDLCVQAETSEPETVAQAREYVRAHVGEEFSLTKVATMVSMSAHYFGEKFKEVTGLHFVEYVTRIRVERARERLLTSTLRIGEIAFEVGFQSLSQFNRAFKKNMGISPSAFRRDIG